jgi:1-acyl-sn-glycerol-3-phosphate acyltransferase
MVTSEVSRRIRVARWLVRILFRVLTRCEVHGADKIPVTGPTLLTMNHLHWLDPPIGFVIVSRAAFMFAADKWERRPLIGDILRWTQSTIFVARGEIDRKALSQALDVLKAGGLLAIAPEGTRSKTGALQQGHEGPAYLASRTGAVIVPVGAYGQEKAVACWKRLRRPHIVVQIGEPYVLPGAPNKAKGPQLAAYTDEIMHRIAALLPPEYRGVYAHQEAAAISPASEVN